MKQYEVDITVTVKVQARLPKDFLIKYINMEDDDLSSMFYEEVFPKWFDVDTNGDEIIIVSRDNEMVDIEFTFNSVTTEHYRPGDWYTPDEYSWDYDELDFSIPKEYLISNHQTFVAE